MVADDGYFPWIGLIGCPSPSWCTSGGIDVTLSPRARALCTGNVMGRIPSWRCITGILFAPHLSPIKNCDPNSGVRLQLRRMAPTHTYDSNSRVRLVTRVLTAHHLTIASAKPPSPPLSPSFQSPIPNFSSHCTRPRSRPSSLNSDPSWSH